MEKILKIVYFELLIGAGALFLILFKFYNPSTQLVPPIWFLIILWIVVGVGFPLAVKHELIKV